MSDETRIVLKDLLKLEYDLYDFIKAKYFRKGEMEVKKDFDSVSRAFITEEGLPVS